MDILGCMSSKTVGVFVSIVYFGFYENLIIPA